MILSLQGGMAAGKTSAGLFVSKAIPSVTFFLEDNSYAESRLLNKKLDKTKFEDFCEIQRIFIRQEIIRYHTARTYQNALLDLGASEIEFYTLFYPQSIGKNWPIEDALSVELAELRKCRPDKTLFLQASTAILNRNKTADISRERGFFAHSTTHLLPLKEQWFASQLNTTFLPVDSSTQDEVGQAVCSWVTGCTM